MAGGSTYSQLAVSHWSTWVCGIKAGEQTLECWGKRERLLRAGCWLARYRATSLVELFQLLSEVLHVPSNVLQATKRQSKKGRALKERQRSLNWSAALFQHQP